MVDENITENREEQTQPNNSLQVKVDVIAGCVVLCVGACFSWPFLHYIIYGEPFSKYLVVYGYSLLLILICSYKGSVLIRRAGGPASANYMDKFSWKVRLFLTLSLMFVFAGLVTNFTGDLGIEMSILLIPMILVYL